MENLYLINSTRIVSGEKSQSSLSFTSEVEANAYIDKLFSEHAEFLTDGKLHSYLIYGYNTWDESRATYKFVKFLGGFKFYTIDDPNADSFELKIIYPKNIDYDPENITDDVVNQFICDEYLGKDANYNSKYDICLKVKSFLARNGVKADDINFRYSGNDIYILYNNIDIININFKRKQGDYKFSYRKYEYNYKSFTSKIIINKYPYDGEYNLLNAVAIIDSIVAKSNEIENKNIEQALEIVDWVNEKYKPNSLYELFNIFNFIHWNQYKLEARYKNRKKEKK